MNGKQFADSISVPHGTVKRWLHEGMPAVRLRHAREVHIEAAAAKAWIADRYPHSISANRRSVVYFAQRGSDGAIKIGFTSDIERRLRELRKHARDTVELIAAFAGAKPDELRLHDRFAVHRMDGEWFRADAEILSYVDGIGWAA